ncbi:hypothetical protein L2E82_15714 [Cichorium intybus]|uniref:Uncharacterized protein n=1 Tax=Cichorium intybus TaxID=13427 RepID=A0ACB9F4U4_CICIN|nr:hypothetical protein L2E82_15714 [Cichorium intybus]
MTISANFNESALVGTLTLILISLAIPTIFLGKSICVLFALYSFTLLPQLYHLLPPFTFLSLSATTTPEASHHRHHNNNHNLQQSV